MKIQILLLVTFAFLFGAIQMSSAQTEKDPIKLKPTEQATIENSDVKIKFLSVIEDSRCPEGVTCIWAGNAKIKIEVSCNSRKEEFEINTNLGPKGASFDGYAINLVDLSPVPKEGSATSKESYIATFEVSRLTR